MVEDMFIAEILRGLKALVGDRSRLRAVRVFTKDGIFHLKKSNILSFSIFLLINNLGESLFKEKRMKFCEIVCLIVVCVVF